MDFHPALDSLEEVQEGEEVHSLYTPTNLQDLTDDYDQPHYQQQSYRLKQHQPYGLDGPIQRTGTTASSSDIDDDLEQLQLETKMVVSSSTHTSGIPLSPHLQPANVLALSSRINASNSPATLRRPNSSKSLTQTAAYERKRGVLGRAAKTSAEERTGFARIYFENQSFTSSTVFKLFNNTTVLEVRKSMANKIKILPADFAYYAIVVVFPSDNAGSLSARTLRDEELILPLVEKLNRARSTTAESDDMLGMVRAKPKHRSRPPVKFVLKDVRGAPLDLDEDTVKKATTEVTQALNFPVLLGKGVHSGYLQKASVKDSNVWRKRWFIVKGDQLLYCKSSSNQRDVTGISLLNAYLAKARPEVSVPFSFELRTPRRIYQLCANSKEEMVAWIHALHVQIGISSENHRLYEAEIMITEDAVTRSEEESYVSPLAEPSLLQRVLSREDTLKIFRDFVNSTSAQMLLDTWIECEHFRRSCIARENGLLTSSSNGTRRTAKDEWEHLRAIVRGIQSLSMIQTEEIMQLRQSFQSEQLSRRLSLALHSDVGSQSNTEYPRVELIAPIHQKIFEAIEAGPFQQFLLQNGYRLLLERIIGCIA